ncbi:MAG: AAA family ATPase [Acidimicrobiia bacterium]
MRPQRLELEGFMAFRHHTEIDFTGVELFALSGPTGAGKTTVIDAIGFALYGVVPRYDDRRLVAPAISQGRNEARVCLDFTSAGELYRAVRVVRRTAKGATTKEARLERVGDGGGAQPPGVTEVLAGNERELTAEVERILGLGFEHFTTCVVLPQGDFARFLHDKPERRQELLVKLLDLGVYDRMAVTARERVRDAETRAAEVGRRLDQLGAATPAARAEAERRVAELEGLRDDVDRCLPDLAALAERAAVSQGEADAATRWADALNAIRVPEAVRALGTERAEAEAAHAEAVRGDEAAATAAERATEALARAPDVGLLRRAQEAYTDRAALTARAAKGAVVTATARSTEDELTGALERAEREAATAADELEAARAAHRAHAVRADLRVGQPCPVCRHPVDTLPAEEVPAPLEAALARHSGAVVEAGTARRALGTARAHRAACEATAAEVDTQLADVERRLDGAPALADLDALMAEAATVRAEADRCRTSATDARRNVVSAEAALRELRARESAEARAFDTTRDTVAALGPPPRTGAGVDADWAALASWASAAGPAQRAVAVAARAAATRAGAERDAGERALLSRAAATGVSGGTGPLRDAVADAVAQARAALFALDDRLAEVARLRAESSVLVERAQLHAAMAAHLGARGFEKWMLDEALALLAAAAGETLRDLTGGRYTLTLDARRSGFLVADQANGGDLRLARTLSGGETFLASLALALALADQIALLASRGATRLEAIFLDEGFGTLDPETLDVVASAVEELGSQGRMVGVISHVAELAERVPVCFEINRGPGTATVTRVDR